MNMVLPTARRTLFLSLSLLFIFAAQSAAAQEISSTLGSSQPVMSAATMAVQQTCGNTADADLVIMIDKTGSISNSDLTNEKNAAKSLLGFFNSASVKPRVAVGSFNDAKSDSARIADGGGLTADYGVDGVHATGLYAAINSITNPNNSTNLGAAIGTAQAELAAHATGPNRYIILVSDGVATSPDAPTPSQCSGGSPGEAATAAATTAKSAGTKIFTVHFGGDGKCPSGTGANLLQNVLATTGAYYFEGNANLSGIFTKISQSIVCNDGNDCTADSCNSGTNQCEYVPVSADTDGDGVMDQCDACPNDSSKQAPGICGCGIAEIDSDHDGLADCVDTCIGGKTDACGVCKGDGSSCSGCDGIAGSNKKMDGCGVCGGDGTSCLDCTHQDISSQLIELDKGSKYQKKAINRIAAHLRKVRWDASTKKAVRKANRLAKQLYGQNNHFIFGVPTVHAACANTSLCFTEDYSDGFAKFGANAKTLKRIAIVLFNTLRKTGADKRLLGMDNRLFKNSFKKTMLLLDLVPKSTSVCVR